MSVGSNPGSGSSLGCDDLSLASSNQESTTTDTQLLEFCNTGGGGGGGGSFESEWSGETYEETSDPLERFVEFPVDAPDGNGVVHLTPLSYTKPRSVSPEPFLPLSDHEVEQAVSDLGLSRAELADDADRFFRGNANKDPLRLQVVDHILNGRWHAAQTDMTGTDADVIYWCGGQDAPTPYARVMIIPTTIPCQIGGQAEENVTLVSRVDGAPYYYKDYIVGTGETVFELSELNMTATILEGNASITQRSAFALAYRDLIWGAETTLDKTWSVSMKARHLDPGLRDRLHGHATWNATPLGAPFPEDDNFSFTEEATSYRVGRAMTVRIAADAADIGFDYDTQASDPNAENIRITHHNATVIDSIQGLIPLASGHQWEFSVANETDGLYVEAVAYVDGDRTKQGISFGSASYLPFLDTELKSTYFIEDWDAFTLQLKGMPGDETRTDLTFPTTNVLRLDFGEAGGASNFSLDLTKNGRANYYRTVVVNSNLTGFPFSAIASLVGRVQYGGGTSDDLTPRGTPQIFHSVNIVRKEGYSNLTALEGFPVPYKSNMSADPDGSSTPTRQFWNFGPDEMCSPECFGWLEGNSTVEARNNITARFWGVANSPTSETVITRCEFVYADGVCA